MVYKIRLIAASALTLFLFGYLLYFVRTNPVPPAHGVAGTLRLGGGDQVTEIANTTVYQADTGFGGMPAGSGNPKSVLKADGKIGVGINPPVYPMHVAGALNGSVFVAGQRVSDTSITNKFGVKVTANGFTLQDGATLTDGLSQKAGNVGIGVQTPSAKFEVETTAADGVAIGNYTEWAGNSHAGIKDDHGHLMLYTNPHLPNGYYYRFGGTNESTAYDIGISGNAFNIGTTAFGASATTTTFGGNVTAPTFIGSLNGNANTATTATNNVLRAGDTMTGGLKVTTPGGSWISGKTGTGGLGAATQQTASAFHPMIRQVTYSGHTIALGGLGDSFGFYMYNAARVDNGYDNSMVFNVGTGAVSFSNTVTAPTFSGNLAWGNLTGVPAIVYNSTAGDWQLASSSNSSSYSSASLELRELNFGGTQTGAVSEAPHLSFHWGGRVASQILMPTDGSIQIRNNPGTGYETLKAGNIYSNDNLVATNNTAPTFSDVYTNGWFRNNNASQGLYNQTTGRHFYSESGSYWTVESGNGMVLRNGHAGTITGYLYWNGTAGSNNFGLLSPNGSWRVRVDNSNTELYGSVYMGSAFANIMYDRNDSGYYLDPNSGSQVSSIYANNWFRAQGSSGFYFQDYGGGWNMTDTTWIRAYNNKSILTAGSVKAYRFEDVNDSSYVDPGGTSSVNRVDAQYLVGATNAGGMAIHIGYYNAAPAIGGRNGNAYDQWLRDDGGGALHLLPWGTGGHSGLALGAGGGVTSFTAYTTAYKPGGGTWAASSDRRLKKNIKPYVGGLEAIRKLKPVEFEWIYPDEHADQTGFRKGFIAQEVEKVFPEFVKYDDDYRNNIKPRKDAALVNNGPILSVELPVDFDAMVVESIQEQQSQIEALKKTVAQFVETLEQTIMRVVNTVLAEKKYDERIERLEKMVRDQQAIIETLRKNK